MTTKESTLKIYTASIVFTLLVGFSFLFSKLAVGVATPLELITFRFDFAVLGIMAAMAMGAVRVGFKGKSIRKVMPVAVFYGGFIVLQAIGINYSTSVEGGIIFAIIPIITMIIAAFLLKEKTSALQKIFVFMSVAGVILMIVSSTGNVGGLNLKGLIILFLSSLSMAFCNVFMRQIRRDFTPTEISFVIVVFCCLLVNGYVIGIGLQNGTLFQYFEPMLDWKFAVSVIYLGITCTFLTSLLISYMLAHMEAVKATLFGNLSTAISILAGVLIFKEPLTGYHLICTVLIIAGVMGTSVSGRLKPGTKP